jgi:hypothetical protein
MESWREWSADRRFSLPEGTGLFPRSDPVSPGGGDRAAF